ncbi:MAG: site-specific integrase [Nitrospinae bacterium]|nr:site-specific integrase [Nitrospinota bacterium]
MAKLTKRVIDSVPHPHTGQTFVRDDLLPGFALRVTSGSKSFVLEKRIHGRVRRLTLGAYGPLTVDQARKKAQELTAAILTGSDPAQARQDRHHELTFGLLAQEYLDRHASQKKSAHNDIAALNKDLSHWRPRRLSAITRNDVAKLHHSIGKSGHPYKANRTVALLRKMFNLATDWGLFPGPNPATKIQMYKEEKRERFIQPKEMPRFMKALSHEPNTYIRTVLLIYLLTGARRNEVLTMQWPDLDLEQALWRLPDTKSGRSHLIPLPKPACELLQDLPKANGNSYVFPGRYGRGHLRNISRAWYRIRGEAQLSDVRIHDIRRTVGSWLTMNGASLPLIGKVLNHSNVSTTQIYARLNLDPVREALESNARKILSFATEQKGGLKK